MTDFSNANSVHASNGAIADMKHRRGFVPILVQRWLVRKIVETVLRDSEPRPEWQAIPPVTPQLAWTVNFLFCRAGVFTSAYRFALAHMRAFATVILSWRALINPYDVIQVKKSRYSRVVFTSLRVGAYRFAEKEQIFDQTPFLLFAQVAIGFPFLMRLLTGKHQTLQDVEQIREPLFSMDCLVQVRA